MPNTMHRLLALLLAAAAYLATPTQAETIGLLSPQRVALGLNYTGITYHPGGGENEEPYKRSFDAEDYWVLLIGFQANADYKVNRMFYIRGATSFYKDCADVWAGFYHIGFRANWDATTKLSLRVGVGPTLLWRQNWAGKVKGYTKDSFFGAAKGGNYQTAAIWYGGDAEVEWRQWEKVSLVYSVIPGYPEVIQNSVGARYNF